MLKIRYAGCLGLSQAILAQLKTPYFENSTSFKVVDLDINQKGVWNFLLVINSNLDSISHHFGDTTTYWLKMTNFWYPPLI